MTYDEANELIKEFCQTWLEWVEGTVETPFDCNPKAWGLCDNFEGWLIYKDYNRVDVTAALGRLKIMFELEGLERTYPFSEARTYEAGSEAYSSDRKLESMHLNPLRVAWVKAHA